MEHNPSNDRGQRALQKLDEVIIEELNKDSDGLTLHIFSCLVANESESFFSSYTTGNNC